MIHPPHRPLLVVVSAPSGTGKTTLCERLLETFDTMSYSVSCTTRPPREGETDGEDYCFLTEQEFEGRSSRAISSNTRRSSAHGTGHLATRSSAP